MFGEPRAYAATNREAAANIRVEPAHLADRTYGVVLFYSRFFATLTRDEAVKAATLLVNAVDEGERLNQQPKVKPTITRKYEEQETTNG